MGRIASALPMLGFVIAGCAGDLSEVDPPSGDPCAATSDCPSAEVCSDGLCVTARLACEDDVANGNETGVDCGGPDCPPCERGEGCLGDLDCRIGRCLRSTCVVGPTAGFLVTPPAGPSPLEIAVLPDTTEGDANMIVEYDYGEGFETATTHTFERVGIHIVTQRVTDANGFEDTVSVAVPVAPPLLPGCHLSISDKSPDADLILGADYLAAEWRNLNEAGVRSDCAIAPRSGVYYYEGTLKPYECDPDEAPDGCFQPSPWLLSFGVATGAVPLDQPPGLNAGSFGVEASGLFFYDGMYQGFVPGGATSTYGLVVDYRRAHPVVHVIAAGLGTPAVVHSQTLSTITSELHAILVGVRRKVGVEVQVNFGSDTTNRPFAFDPVAALEAADLSDAAEALTLGFGGTREQPANTRPTLRVSDDRSVSLGTPVTLSGSANDSEDGDLSEGIYWEDMATPYGSRTSTLGPTFELTATQIGVHPVRATVFDSAGGRRQAIVRVTVTGTPTQYDPVELVNDPRVDPNVGDGIVTDGLRVRWTRPQDMGIRANQGLYGEFWYFEVTRHIDPANRGAGVATWEGDLRPYASQGAPPSVSINMSGAVWHDIIYMSEFDTSESTYGFAVDYRRENPVVSVIIGGSVVAEWAMLDAFVPLHPLLYGDSIGSEAMFDMTINFGATPFVQDPCVALAEYGLDPADVRALELGWGDANTAASCP